MVSENKAVYGFRILVILSHVDGHLAIEESQVAERYVAKHFNDDLQVEKEKQFLKSLKPADYFAHFKECMDHFYSRSSTHERAELVKFAVDMIKADKKITSEENIYLNELVTGWEPEHTG